MKTFQFNVDGIDCANCAKELEEEIGKLDGVSNCSLEFGVHSHLKYNYEGNDAEAGIEEELGEKATVIATGGLSQVVIPLCRHEITYDDDLLLKGLMIIWNKNSK